MLAVATIFLFTSDLGFLKPRVENAIATATGRSFAIEGRLSLNIGGTTELEATNVVFGNAAGFDAAEMLRVERIFVRLDSGSLLSGPAIVELIDIDGVTLLLQESGDGERNWELDLPKDDAVDSTVSSDDAAVHIETLQINAVDIRFDSAVSEQRIDVVSASIEQQRRPDDMLQLSVRALVNDRTLSFEALWGSWSGLLAGAAVEMEATGVLDTMSLVANARVADLQTQRVPEFEFSLEGPELSDLSEMLGLHSADQGSVDLSGYLRPTQDGRFALGIEGKLGSTTVNGLGFVASLDTLEEFDVELSAKGPSFGKTMSALGIVRFSDVPIDLAISLSRSDEGLVIDQSRLSLGDSTIGVTASIPDFPTLKGTQLNVALKGDRIENLRRIFDLPGVSTGRYQGSVDVFATGTGFPKVAATLQTDIAELKATGIVGGTVDLAGTELDVTLTTDSLMRFGNALNVDGLPNLPASIDGKVEIDDGRVTLPALILMLGQSRFDIEGQILSGSSAVQTAFSFTGSGPAFEELFSSDRSFELRPGPFSMSGQIETTPAAIRIDDFELARDRGKLGVSASIAMPLEQRQMNLAVKASGPAMGSFVSKIGSFELNDAPFMIDVLAERDGDLWALSPAAASIGDTRFEADGELRLTEAAVDGALNVSIVVPDLAQLGTVDARPFSSQALSIQSTMRGNLNSVNADVDLKIGNSDVSGQIIVTPLTVPKVDINLSSASITVLPILEPADTPPPDVAPDNDGHMIPDTPLDFSFLHRLESNFAIRIDELQSGVKSASEFSLSGNIQDGTMSIDQFGVNTAGGRIELEGLITNTPTDNLLEITATANRLNFSSNAQVPMDTSLAIDIETRGTSLRRLAGQANGFVAVNANGGEFTRSALLDAMYGGFVSQILDAINPLQKSAEFTKLECSALLVDIVDGLAQGHPAFYAQTDKLRLLANAQLELSSEEITVDFRTRPNGDLKLVSVGEVLNPYLGVAGTLSNPRLDFDEKNAFFSGGAALATGGLSILGKGLWDRLRGSKDPCGTARTRYQEFVKERRGSGELNPQLD